MSYDTEMGANPPRVLVIEDDPRLVGLLIATLESEGYDVAVTESALGAVELVRRVQPAVILLDLGLPYRSGGSVLADVKADPDLAPIPVIIVSALADSLPDERKAMAAAVITKPFSPNALLDAIRAARHGAG